MCYAVFYEDVNILSLGSTFPSLRYKSSPGIKQLATGHQDRAITVRASIRSHVKLAHYPASRSLSKMQGYLATTYCA